MIAEVTVRFRSLAIFNLTAIVVLIIQNGDFLFSREGGYATQSQTGRELKTGRDTQFKSGEMAARNGRKGGIVSGETKRANKSLASLAKSIAQQPAPDKLKGQIKRVGLAIDDEDMTCNAAIVAGVYGKAVSGDDKAVDRWETWTSEGTADDKPFKIPAEIIGKAFVDINRQIVPNKSYIFKGGRGGLKSSYISEKIPELLIQQMAGRNPRMQQAYSMIQGKTPEQLKQMAENMAKERGMTVEKVAKNIGLM